MTGDVYRSPSKAANGVCKLWRLLLLITANGLGGFLLEVSVHKALSRARFFSRFKQAKRYETSSFQQNRQMSLQWLLAAIQPPWPGLSCVAWKIQQSGSRYLLSGHFSPFTPWLFLLTELLVWDNQEPIDRQYNFFS